MNKISFNLISLFKENIINLYEGILIFLKLNFYKFINIFIYLLLIVIFYFIFKILINRLIKVSMNLKNIPYSQDRLITLSSVFTSILKVILGFVFILLILKEFDVNIIHILTGAGVIGAAVVYIFQGIIQDIMRGWILIFEDQMRKGEWVNINNSFIGKVLEFNLRHVVLRDRERNLIFIPNSQINMVWNLSRREKKKVIKVKLKNEIEISEILKKIENLIKKFKEENKNISEVKLEKDINISSEFVEVFISFKTKFLLLEEISQKLKIKIYEELKPQILEIS